MTALYNEIDPYAAQWTRNLIAAGHVAPGVVDERSIVDLAPADVAGPGQRHFFAGIAVWSYALRLARVPDDADIWTASCPCQPFSGAGRRRGTADERHLWPALLALVKECRPPVLFGEQVASRDGRAWLAAVRADLESLGYAVGAADLCAASVGAPHIRQRLYFVAYADDVEGRLLVQPWAARRADAQARGCGEVGGLAHVIGERWQDRVGSGSASRSTRRPGDLADSASVGRLEWLDERKATTDHGARSSDDRWTLSLANTETERRGSRRLGGTYGREALESERLGASGWMGNARSPRGGRDTGADARAEAAREGAWLGTRGVGDEPCAASADDPWSACDWIPCSDGKSRPVEPGTFPLAHGVAGRVGRLRAYGNAIVTEQAAVFIRVALGAVTA